MSWETILRLEILAAEPVDKRQDHKKLIGKMLHCGHDGIKEMLNLAGRNLAFTLVELPLRT